MKQQKFVDLVKKHFDYLFKEYGFLIVYSEPDSEYKNRLVVLQSKECKFRMYIDRSWYLVEGAFKNADNQFNKDWLNPESPDRWYDLSFVLAYLTRGSSQIEFEYKEPPNGLLFNQNKHVESEMIRISKSIRPQVNEVITFFKEDGFSERQKEINTFLKERAIKKRIITKEN